MNWLENSFSPKMNQFASNPWIASVSEAMNENFTVYISRFINIFI